MLDEETGLPAIKNEAELVARAKARCALFNYHTVKLYSIQYIVAYKA
jgi:hypothetical protein